MAGSLSRPLPSSSPSRFSHGPSAPPFVHPPLLSAPLYFHSPPAELGSPPSLPLPLSPSACLYLELPEAAGHSPRSSVTDTDSYSGGEEEEEGWRAGRRRVRVAERGITEPSTRPQAPKQVIRSGWALRGWGRAEGQVGVDGRGTSRWPCLEVALSGWGAEGLGRGGHAGNKGGSGACGVRTPRGQRDFAGHRRSRARASERPIWVSAAALPAPAACPAGTGLDPGLPPPRCCCCCCYCCCCCATGPSNFGGSLPLGSELQGSAEIEGDCHCTGSDRLQRGLERKGPGFSAEPDSRP